MEETMYIVLEGLVHCGKSTLARMLYAYLKDICSAKEVIYTWEPGGTKVAIFIRNLVQVTDFEDEKINPYCSAYLYAAARAQSLRLKVKPCLDRGGIVISDRSFLTSIVYQGYVQGLGIKCVEEINRGAVEGVTPDIVLWLSVAPEVALQRCKPDPGDKWELENLEFHRKVHEGYKLLSTTQGYARYWYTLDANAPIDKVFNDAVDILRKHFSE